MNTRKRVISEFAGIPAGSSRFSPLKLTQFMYMTKGGRLKRSDKVIRALVLTLGKPDTTGM